MSLKCPHCGSRKEFSVYTTTILIVDGKEKVLGEKFAGLSNSYDKGDTCFCEFCNFSGDVREFRAEVRKRKRNK